MARIPDKVSFDKFLFQLDNYYAEVSKELNFDKLTESVGHQIIKYFMKTYPPLSHHNQEVNKTLRLPYNGPLYDEIGYWIMKQDLGKRLTLDDSLLLIDATMGWLSYNPDGYHEAAQIEKAKQYLNCHDAQKFKDNFNIVEADFANLQKILLPCMSSGAIPGTFEGYPEFFKQSSMRVSFSKRLLYRQLDL